MSTTVAHLVQYQGSKRKLAPQILQYMPQHCKRLLEPFSGMAALSLAAAAQNRADFFVINDLNRPLVALLQEAVEQPERLVHDYTAVWQEQFSWQEGGHVQHYFAVRERFNQGAQQPAHMLYLLARCVKGAVRYSSTGQFNQSPDKRRHGTRPDTLQRNVSRISALLKGRCTFRSEDYRQVLALTEPGDVVYLDPPYQGVSETRDQRYFSGLPFEEFAASLEVLNERGVDFLVSYDGTCGDKAYGKDLPASLGCRKILLQAGLSSQALLLGRRSVTCEALYLSRRLSALAEASDAADNAGPSA